MQKFTNISRAYWKPDVVAGTWTIYKRRGHVQFVGSCPFQKLQTAFPSFYDSAYEREVNNGNGKPRRREREKMRAAVRAWTNGNNKIPMCRGMMLISEIIWGSDVFCIDSRMHSLMLRQNDTAKLRENGSWKSMQRNISENVKLH